MNKALMIFVSLAAGVGLGTLIPDSSANVEASAHAIRPTPSATDVTLDIGAIRSMLREELKGALAGSQHSQGEC